MNCSTCDICTENFNRSTRIKIKCEYCEFTSCRTCVETYLLSQSTPHCMCSAEQCGKVWTRKFLSNNFTNSFITKKYKLHQEQILFEKELALMPATQMIIERKLYKEKKTAEYTDEISHINKLISDLIDRKHEAERSIRRLSYNFDDEEEEHDNDGENNDGEETKGEKTKKMKFSYRCSNDNCRGFLSSRWKCQLCETWTCHECRVNIGKNEDKESHICNNDDLETAKMLRKDSKPCPKCGIIIFKIDGCDQMYCTQCHTPFSWRTGEIEIGRNIHNPHYFEYIRNHGGVPRNPLDIQCGRVLDMYFIDNLSSSMIYISRNFDLDDNSSLILNICRNISHLNHEIMNIRQSIDLNENKKQQYRIKYLQNKITEEDFKKIIQMNEKKYQKYQELLNLFIMVKDTGTEILHVHYDKLNKIDDVLKIKQNKFQFRKYINLDIGYKYVMDEYTQQLINEQLIIHDVSGEQILLELNNLCKYANECFREITKTYHSIDKYFDESFKISRKMK